MKRIIIGVEYTQNTNNFDLGNVENPSGNICNIAEVFDNQDDAREWQRRVINRATFPLSHLKKYGSYNRAYRIIKSENFLDNLAQSRMRE